jgi:ElaB/YqjD/DUF883 family membrane-anchored ribosome-binding protein
MAESDAAKQVESLKEDIAKLRTDMTALFHDFMEAGKEEVSATTEKAGSEVKKGVEAVEKAIGEKPLLTLLSALAIGFLVGKLLDRK